MEDIDEVHQLDPVHRVDHKDELAGHDHGHGHPKVDLRKVRPAFGFLLWGHPLKLERCRED